MADSTRSPITRQPGGKVRARSRAQATAAHIAHDDATITDLSTGPDPAPGLQQRLGNRATLAALTRPRGLADDGQPLPDALRLSMQQRFGTDFSDVRMHDDALAHASARSHGAKAYTHGEHIVFSARRFAPDSAAGLRLLAHELAHVVQQRRGGATPGAEPHSANERAADAAAQAATHGTGPVTVAGASAVGVACDKEDEEDEKEERKGQASTTVLSQQQLKAPTPEQPIELVTDPNKARGTRGEVNVPFDRYSGPQWNHIGGGSETASSRTSLARQSGHDKARGNQQGTAGIDFIVEHVRTGRLVIGEQKATAAQEFPKASAITTSLEKNIAHSAEVLRQQLKQGKLPPAEVARLKNTIARLEATHKVLQNPSDTSRLPPGVVFELTNVGGKGQTIGKQYMDGLAEKYGKVPGFMEHLLGRTFVRDPQLAKAKGRPAGGKPGTDSDPDVVPARELLNESGKDVLERVKAGKSKSDWARQKRREKAQEKAAKAKADAAAKKERATETAKARAAREAARKQLQKDAKKAGDKARKQHLKDAKASRKRAGLPEPTTVKARKADDVAANKAGRAETKAYKERQAKAARARAAADTAARKAEATKKAEAERQRKATRRKQAAERAAHKKAIADALAKVEAQKNMTPEDWGKLPKADRQLLENAAANDPKLAARLNEKVNARQTADFHEQTRRKNAELPKRNKKQQDESGAKASKVARGMNQAAAGLRAADAFADARDKGKGYGEAGFEAGKTYLENTNEVLGAAATIEARMRTETLPDGTTQQYYGEDAGDAFFGTLGETLAGRIVPGAGWDQLVNGGANLIGAVDDHVKRGDAPVDPAKQEASLRTGTDLAAELTPSRMFATTIGGGARAWYDLGKAAGGQTSGVDKFADDAVRGKMGSILQPWAMAADFAGELGGSDASTALATTLKKTEGTTLTKLGNSSGDAMYDLGQSTNAKAGMYGGTVQSVSTVLGVTSDMIAGQDFNTAIDKAAAEGSTDAKVIAGVRDTAKAASSYASEVWNEDLAGARETVSDTWDSLWD